MSIRIIDCRPPKIALLFLLAAAILHWATPMNQSHTYSNPVLGVILGMVGFVVMMWAWQLFKKFGTAICPTAKTDCLVTTEIYKYTWNPMYMGIFGMRFCFDHYMRIFRSLGPICRGYDGSAN